VAETQQVIIEFLTDTAQVDTAINKLEKTGAIDSKLAQEFKKNTTEISKQGIEIQKTAAATAPLKKNLEDVAKATKGFSGKFMADFQKQFLAAGGTVDDFKGGIQDALDEAGVSMEEFIAAIEARNQSAEKSTESLRQRLKILTEQITAMKLAGDDGTEAFKALVAEAANIKSAMANAGKEINNVGSDTRTLDNLLGSAQAVAGGFAVAQGTIALFGDENEDLQKTLLKVNALMAILQGSQSVVNALQKEGAIVQLFSNKQKIIGNAQLAVENGLQSTSIVVRLGAAVAQRILNAAMAANPILLFISALILVVTAMAAYIKSSKEAEIQTGDLNAAVEAATEGFENYALQIKQQSEKATSELEKNGALQSKILESQLTAEQDINNKRSQEIARLRKFLTTSRDADEAAIKAANDRLAQLTKDRNEADIKAVVDKNAVDKQLREESIKSQIATAETALLAAKEGSQKQLQLQKQLVSLRAQEELNAAGLTEEEKINIGAKGNQERLELDAAFNKRRIDLQLQGIETQLVNVREGSQQELDLRKQQIKLQVASEITNTKLSEKEKQAIVDKGFQDRLKLQREYNERVRKESIEAQISKNEEEIAQIKTNDEDRLILQIANFELAATLEVDAAKGNAEKIKGINAKRDSEILKATKDFIDAAAQYEIDIRTADNGPSGRALQRIIADEKKGLSARTAAIKQVADFQISNIDIQLAALEEEKNKKLISDKDYILKYKQLQDQKKQITEDSEKATTDLIKEQNRLRQEVAFAALNAIATVISDINANQTAQENQRIEEEKQRVADLLEAGAITENEAKKRNKRIEAEEKRLKREQAIREKNLAIFNALINTAQAITVALASAPPPYNIILAAISAALGAAQIAAISSRPIPKFAKGKKDRYEGPGEIGEAGAELMEHDGQLYIAKKRTLVWLGKDDKVYNPTETKEMLMPTVDKQLMQWQAPVQKAEGIDYDKLGKAVGKHINLPGINIDEEGFKIWEQQGQSRKNYMDKRYSSK
jgi:hypothetical protein